MRAGLPPVRRLAVADRGNRVLGGFNGVKALHEVRAMGENRQARKDVEMHLVICRGNEEEVPRRLAVRRAEERQEGQAPVIEYSVIE